MDEQIKTNDAPENTEDLAASAPDELDDLAAEFATAETVAVDDEQVSLAEDLTGFVNSFPKWDLLPPDEKELDTYRARKKKK